MENENQTPSQLGLVHVITGDGKGKTTSALGLSLRAAGHGFRRISHIKTMDVHLSSRIVIF